MPETLLSVVVRNRQQQTDDIISVELTSADGMSLPKFEAGAHIDLHLSHELIRQYSLCGDPRDKDMYRLGILRDPKSRGGSVAAHDILLESSEITISAPRNHFPLVAGEHNSILIGGGIGITPMMSMAYTLEANEKPFKLFYCGRAKTTCAFLDELKESKFSEHVTTYFDDENEKLDIHKIVNDGGTNSQIYVCGPTGFMNWVIESLINLGFPEGSIHKEFFNVEVETTGSGFEVVAQKSGVVVQVGENESIANALKASGVKVSVSCEQGTCGTCLCDVIEGIPEHRDVFMTGEEKSDNDQLTLCCSRSLSPRLILDI